jgi:outer membrane lipoprotein LolB
VTPAENLTPAGRSLEQLSADVPRANSARTLASPFLNPLLVLLCGLWLPACGTLTRAPVVDPARVNAFDLAGRVNVRVESKAYPGRIHWQHAPGADEVWLYSPIGSAVARMRQDASGALLVTSDGKEYRADDLQRLARQVLGWDLPLGGLQYWVRGLEWPALAPGQRDDDDKGRPKLLKQGDWQIAYLDWSPAGVSGLPSKLDLTGAGLRMRLVIDEWKIDGIDP